LLPPQLVLLAIFELSMNSKVVPLPSAVVRCFDVKPWKAATASLH
jgi:hypothetical protein